MTMPVPLYLVVIIAAATALATLLVARMAASAAARREQTTAARAREDERFAFLGTLAAGLAHEMRSPLSTLTVNLDLLKERWKNPITDREQREYRKIETLLRETRRLEEIVDNFLRFAGGHDLVLREESIEAILREIADLPPSPDGRPVNVVREIAPNLPPVMVDRNLIRQALLNIMVNARQAMPEGGAITLRALPHGDTLRLEIADTGAGIPDDARQRIFNVYYSTKKGGMGLGLSITKRIIEKHGGSISFSSEQGRGTTFRIDLPASPSRDKERVNHG